MYTCSFCSQVDGCVPQKLARQVTNSLLSVVLDMRVDAPDPSKVKS